jgi:hypothetical protein
MRKKILWGVLGYVGLVVVLWGTNRLVYRGVECVVENRTGGPVWDVKVLLKQDSGAGIALSFPVIQAGESAGGRIYPQAVPGIVFLRQKGGKAEESRSDHYIDSLRNGRFSVIISRADVKWIFAIKGLSIPGEITAMTLVVVLTPVWVPFLLWESFKGSIL